MSPEKEKVTKPKRRYREVEVQEKVWYTPGLAEKLGRVATEIGTDIERVLYENEENDGESPEPDESAD